MALNGLNFELRNVRPADDAKLYSTIYTDGRMTACALTYSGANLTIAKGVLMVKGRMIALDNDETVATVPTYANGFGRIKLKIDLSQAPSASTFTQGSLICEYASTNSFSALTQDDINDGESTVYEIEICRLQYASGSISAIVSQCPHVGHKMLIIRNANDASRVYARYNSADDVGQLTFYDGAAGSMMVGSNKNNNQNIRGIWLWGQNSVPGIYITQNVPEDHAYIGMRRGSGASNQIYLQTTEGGGKITLRNADGTTAVELYVDATSGGMIRLYNANGTVKQTIGG